MSKVKKEALANILKAAEKAVSGMDADTKEAFAALQELQNSCETDAMDLVDCTQYKTYILWSGVEDVCELIKSGCFNRELKKLSESELEALLQKVVNNVEWSDVEAVGVEAGNDIIMAALTDALSNL